MENDDETALLVDPAAAGVDIRQPGGDAGDGFSKGAQSGFDSLVDMKGKGIAEGKTEGVHVEVHGILLQKGSIGRGRFGGNKMPARQDIVG